jgi:arylsulfatase A-like enzyme
VCERTFNVQGIQKLVERYSTHFVRDRALRYLTWFERRDDRPWFLYVAPFAPHPKAVPEPKYMRAKVPVWGRSPAVFEEDRTISRAMCRTPESTRV